MRTLVAGAASLPILLLFAGCGGHAAVGKGGGRATLTVKWPARATRLIPNAANAITVALTLDGKAVATKTIPRPADGTATSSTTLTGLAYGTYAVSARSFPNADGSGVAQAAGGGAMKVTEDTPGTLAVAMDSTVASLAILQNGVTVGVGAPAYVTASGKDASGAVVLLSAGGGAESLAWTAAPAGAATIVGAGPTVSVTSDAAGPVTLTASLKVKDDGTTLTATGLITFGTVDYRLAVGGYPKTGGDAGNTGSGGGSGAVGTLGWTATVGSTAVGAVVVGADGAVYTGAGSAVTAVSRDGVALWRATVAGRVNGLLLTRDGGALVSADKLTSLGKGGAVNWIFPDSFGVSLAANEACYAPNALLDGTVVEATSANVFALDPSATAVRWSVPFKAVGGAAIAADDTVVVRNYGQVCGLAGASGAKTFSVDAAADVTPGGVGPYVHTNGFVAEPCVTGDTVAFAEAVFNGSRSTYIYPYKSPNGVTYYALNGYWKSFLRKVASSGGTATSTTLASSAVNLSRTSTSGPPSTRFPQLPGYPSVTGIADGLGGAYALTDPTTGFGAGWSSQWRATLVGAVGASVDAAGVVYFATTDASGLVEAIDPTTGAAHWIATLPGKGTGLRPAIGPDGSVYAGTADGRVVQIR